MASATASAAIPQPRPFPVARVPGGRLSVIGNHPRIEQNFPSHPPPMAVSAPAAPTAAAVAATAAAASTPATQAAASSSSAVVHPLTPPTTPFLSARVHQHRQCVRLGKPYTEFEVRVVSPSLHWECWKRYSQFASFHHELLRTLKRDSRTHAAAKKVPKLPPSKLVGNLRSEFLERRLADLDAYLQAVLAAEELNTCIPVLAFLGALESGGAVSSRASEKRSSDLSHLHLDAVLPLLDAGDVVLFRTKGVLQGLQRKFTGSKYDHVGIVIRIPWGSVKPSSLHLLESTSDGVRTYNLMRRMRAWHLCGAVVAVRQLKNVRRTNTFLSDLDAFVSDVDGLPYGLTLGKLLRREPGQSKDNFFCSELVATAYMRVGLLDASVCNASSFYPSSFNQENSDAELRLQHGAALGQELLVDFVQPAVSEARSNQSADDESDDGFPFERNGHQRSSSSAQAQARRRGLTASRAEGRATWAPMAIKAARAGSSSVAGSPMPSPSPTSSGSTAGGVPSQVSTPPPALSSFAQNGLLRSTTDSPISTHTHTPALDSDGDFDAAYETRSRASTLSSLPAFVGGTTSSPRPDAPDSPALPSTPEASQRTHKLAARYSRAHAAAEEGEDEEGRAVEREEDGDEEAEATSDDSTDADEPLHHTALLAALSLASPTPRKLLVAADSPVSSAASSDECAPRPSAATPTDSTCPTRSNSEDAQSP